MKPIPTPIKAKIEIEEKEEEGISITRPKWKPQTIYYYKGSNRNPAQGDYEMDTFQLLCTNRGTTNHEGEEVPSYTFLNKMYVPTYHKNFDSLCQVYC